MIRGCRLVALACGENTADGRMMSSSQTKAKGFGLGFLLFIFLLIHIFHFSLWAKSSCCLENSAYDPNLEVSFQGKILKVYLPPKGLAVLEVEREGKSFSVFLCPVRHYYLINPDFKEGDLVEVTGAKTFYKKLGIIFMARHVRNLRTGNLFLFRSPVPPYRPVWE